MSYVAPLEGIRAIAIIAVLLFHVAPTALRGGFTGVDVFFVLSGFLITSKVVEEIRGGRFTVREFYLRRMSRLLPNLLLLVLVVLLLWKFLLPPSMARQAASQSLWALFGVSNIYNWRYLGGYWGDAAEWAPLTHTWFLGVEMQFLLLFPIFLLVLTRFWPNGVRSWLAVGMFLSFGLCLYGTNVHPTATFYLLPTRVWQLLLGAFFATRPRRIAGEVARPPLLFGVKARNAMGLVGLGMIIAGFFFIDESVGFPGLVSLVPTVGTLFLLISVTTGETRVSRWLSSPFMTGTGKLSYSLYLWHWPLITFGRIQADLRRMSQLAGSAGGALVGILLALAAYVMVETPFRKRGVVRSWRMAAAATGFIFAATGAVVFAFRQPVADPSHRFDTPAFYGLLFDAGRPSNDELADTVRYYDVYFPPLPHRDDAWRTGGIVHLYGGGHPNVVVLGSSHALMYSRLIDDVCREKGLSVAFLGVDMTPPFFEASINPNFPSAQIAREFDEARMKWLKEWRPDAVFIIDRWGVRVSAKPDFNVKLRSFLSEVSPLVGRVVFVSQVPVADVGSGINMREFITWRMSAGKCLPRLIPDSNERLRQEADTTAKRAMADFKNLRVLEADLPFYQKDGSIRYASGRSFLYADCDHLTDAGANVVRGLFDRAIAEALPSAPCDHGKPCARQYGRRPDISTNQPALRLER